MERIIVISPPGDLAGEAEMYGQLLRLGLRRLHLRKPGWSSEKLLQLAEGIPPAHRERVVVHHRPVVREKAGLGGLHLPYGAVAAGYSAGRGCTLSCSVHRWPEAEAVADQCDYLFISPVFDSLSKNGYFANRDLQQVPEHLKQHKIFALGGISDQTVERVRVMGYYGVALLGYLWNEPAKALNRFEKLALSACLG